MIWHFYMARNNEYNVCTSIIGGGFDKNRFLCIMGMGRSCDEIGFRHCVVHVQDMPGLESQLDFSSPSIRLPFARGRLMVSTLVHSVFYTSI